MYLLVAMVGIQTPTFIGQVRYLNSNLTLRIRNKIREPRNVFIFFSQPRTQVLIIDIGLFAHNLKSSPHVTYLTLYILTYCLLAKFYNHSFNILNPGLKRASKVLSIQLNVTAIINSGAPYSSNHASLLSGFWLE